MLCFRILLSRRLQNICVAAKGAIRFSVRVTSVARTFLFWRLKTRKEMTDAADIRMEVLYEKTYCENFEPDREQKPDAALKALLYANPFLKAQSKEEREDFINLALMLSQIAASEGAKIEVLLFEDQEYISTVISARSFFL